MIGPVLQRDRFGLYAAVIEQLACRCGRVTFFARNRDGETRCLDCDAKYAAAKSEEQWANPTNNEEK